MAGDVDHVIHPPHHPEVSVGIATGTITGEVQIGAIGGPDVLPVAFTEALGIAVNGAHHSGPRGPNREVTAFIGAAAVALGIDDVGLNSR